MPTLRGCLEYFSRASLNEATTAAVLRSGHLSHAGNGNPDDLLAIDLSSERVRLAMWLLDGVRQGQPLSALLGYRFERRLQEAEEPQFVSYFRELAPLVAKKLETTDEPVEAIAANNVWAVGYQGGNGGSQGAVPLIEHWDGTAWSVVPVSLPEPLQTSDWLRGISAAFNFGSTQDSKNSTSVIGGAAQGGLGLPDRDYYTKTDSASETIRKNYVAHMRRMFALAGEKPRLAGVFHFRR